MKFWPSSNIRLDSEFVQVFGMDRRSFSLQPKWKQDSQKKSVGLFWDIALKINLLIPLKVRSLEN